MTQEKRRSRKCRRRVISAASTSIENSFSLKTGSMKSAGYCNDRKSFCQVDKDLHKVNVKMSAKELLVRILANKKVLSCVLRTD